MLITAKYPATCCACHRPIVPGAKIEWAKGAPVRHATCGSTATAPATRPAASRCACCGEALSAWEVAHRVRRCGDCRDGGANARGGQSYYTRSGEYVLGADD